MVTDASSTMENGFGVSISRKLIKYTPGKKDLYSIVGVLYSQVLKTFRK